MPQMKLRLQRFFQIELALVLFPSIIDRTLNLFDYQPAQSIEDLLSQDQIARKLAQKEVLSSS